VWLREALRTASGFAVFAADDADSLTAIASVSLVARVLNLNWVVVYRDAKLPADSLIETEVHGRSVVASADEVLELAPTLRPVVVALRDGVILDAVAGAVGPSQIDQMSRFFESRRRENPAVLHLTGEEEAI
jgi:hypothetical protein